MRDPATEGEEEEAGEEAEGVVDTTEVEEEVRQSTFQERDTLTKKGQNNTTEKTEAAEETQEGVEEEEDEEGEEETTGKSMKIIMKSIRKASLNQRRRSLPSSRIPIDSKSL